MQEKNSKNIYRVKNWKDYNNSLINRGSITVYIKQETLNEWKAKPQGTRGHQKEYSDAAIQMMIMIRKIFHLRLRQLQGFICSIFNMQSIDLPVPNYSTVSRRGGKIKISLPKTPREHIVAIFDSTGLKIFGEGEWKVRQHGYSKRRNWKKLHIMIDQYGEIRALELTGNNVDDAEMVADLIKDEKDKIIETIGDGAYDKKKVYDQFDDTVKVNIPPCDNAVSGLAPARDAILCDILNSSLADWKINNGYHVRSGVENTMYRIKTIFGGMLFSRNDENQINESKIMCAALNKISKLGMPESYLVKGK